MAEAIAKKRYEAVFDLISDKNFPAPEVLGNTASSEEEKQLMQALAQLENEYIASVKADALKEIEANGSGYIMPDESEIEESAEKAVNADYNNRIASSKNKFDSAVDKIEQQILSADNKNASTQYNFEQSYYAKEKALAEGIAKHGLATSSIAELTKSELQNDKAHRNEFLIAEANQQKAKLEQEITSLNSEYELALEGFEIAKAAAIKKKTAELKLEAQKQAKAAEAINAQIEQEKQAYLDAFANTLAEKEQNDANIGSYEGVKKENYEKRYLLAKEYYGTLDKDTARKMLAENSVIKEKLGIYYEKLLNDLKS
ncbi:MAG: hypothetical protein EOM87_07215 [Clostridia bacterium]|nr:hypothetical protein [Clostridia bacterium]